MIGVFDSGVGGLSVHHALTRKLPRADFIYLADQANTPYGGRAPGEIVELTRASCIRLFEEGASLVVLACNTAAAIALHPLQRDWLPGYRQTLGWPVNVIGLIVPTIEAATGMPWKSELRPEQDIAKKMETIGIFATPATVRSDVYAVEIHKRRPDMHVVQEPCPDIARMIESGASLTQLEQVIAQHARVLTDRIGNVTWQAILGCTHYEIVADIFARHLPATTKLIHQPAATANALSIYLAHHPEYAAGQSGLRRFITTGPALQSRLAEEFWGAKLMFETREAA